MILLDEGIEIFYDNIFNIFNTMCVWSGGGWGGEDRNHYSHAAGEKTRAETQTMEVTRPV